MITPPILPALNFTLNVETHIYPMNILIVDRNDKRSANWCRSLAAHAEHCFWLCSQTYHRFDDAEPLSASSISFDALPNLDLALIHWSDKNDFERIATAIKPEKKIFYTGGTPEITFRKVGSDAIRRQAITSKQSLEPSQVAAIVNWARGMCGRPECLEKRPADPLIALRLGCQYFLHETRQTPNINLENWRDFWHKTLQTCYLPSKTTEAFKPHYQNLKTWSESEQASASPALHSTIEALENCIAKRLKPSLER